MHFLRRWSISKKLTLLVLFAVLPALLILLHAGVEQRRNSIEAARQEVLLLTHSMAQAQQDLTNSARQLLLLLSLLPEIRALDLEATRGILADVLAQNPDYLNIALSDLDGNVLISGRTFVSSNLSDRKHFKEALEKRDFAVGEFILSRVGVTVPAFAFAYPVPDREGNPKAVLTTAIRLDRFARFFAMSPLPDHSYVAVTDHRGIRLFYYPPREETNPVGSPIRADVWAVAGKAREPGTLIARGSDNRLRINAFRQVRLDPEAPPYVYVWAGVPEEHVLAPANAAMARDLLLLLLALAMALGISRLMGRKTLLAPLHSLIAMTGRFAKGDLEARAGEAERSDEIGDLARAFHDMAAGLAASQNSLRENEARFRLLMDSLDALVYVADMNTYEILFINSHGRRIFGDVTGGICWQSLQKGQDGPCSFCTNRYLLDRDGNPGEVYPWEFQNTFTGLWLHIRDRAIRWTDGRIVRLEIATDITARKLAEAKLAEERERLAVTLASIGEGVITSDTEGRVVLLNRVAEALTGWQSEEAAGRPLAEIFRVVDGESGEPCQSPVTGLLAAERETTRDCQAVLLSRTGHKRNISENGSPIRDREGRIIGVVLVFRDTTEQRRTEQELLKAKKLESVGVLAGGIAHDFNNILTALMGNIDLSLMDQDLSGETREMLTEALKASARARDLTQQLLTFSKGGDPVRKAASLPEVIRDSAEFILRGRTVACRYHFPENLRLVDIDRGQISQVVQNIILNAVDAMPRGGAIEVSCENFPQEQGRAMGLAGGSDWVAMRIKDSGTGIPAHLLEKIFDPYFSTKHQGSGLGLAITHAIVTKHGGRISVESAPQQGTTFTILLPAAGEAGPARAPEKKAGKAAQPARILVMDDEEQIRNMVQAMLSRLGHQVVLARDGDEAVRFYQEAMEAGDPFALAVMDLTIPGGMGGREAAQRILDLDGPARLVVSSGYSSDPVMANFREHGFCAAMKKPYQLAEFRSLLDRLLA